MIVLHGSWLDNEWLLWGEDTSEVGARTDVDDDCPNTLQPFWGCRREALVTALTAVVTTTGEGSVDRCRTGIAWLPAVGKRVVPSRPWLRRAIAGPRLEAHHLWTLPLASEPLFDLLAAVAENRRLGRGIMAGNDLAAWSDLLRYAGAIVARRQYLPNIRPVPHTGSPRTTPPPTGPALTGVEYESCWTPALDQAETRRFELLAEQLPNASVCLSREAKTPPCRADKTTAARAFLDETVDRLARLAAVTTLSRAHAERGRYFGVHDAWAASLRGEKRTIRWENSADVAALAEEVARWRRPLDLERQSPLRLMIDVEEPDTDETPWRLRYRVAHTAHTERDERLDWNDIWQDNRVAAADREGLLVTLGQAALLTPAVSAVGDAGAALTTSEAHRFMRHDAPLLEAAGFAVRLPAWWQTRDSQIQVVAHVGTDATPTDASFSLTSLVDVDWQIAIGGEPVTAAELTQLAESGQALVRFRDRWVEINRVQINEALRLWRRKQSEARAANDIVRLMLGIDRDAHGLTVAGVQADGWLGQLIRRLRGETALEPIPPPQGFCGTLRPYQERGYAWLVFLRQWGLGACLADDMGLGKTVQALALVAREWERGERRPVLLVCPTSVLTNWKREAGHFVPQLPLHVHHGADRSVAGSFVTDATDMAMVVTSYPLLYRDYATLRQVAWSGVILDEAQNIKNPDTRQAQAARALQADYRVALTGTPVENHVGDLWSIMDFLNPGLLGGRTAFRETFALPIKTGVDLSASDRLRQMTAPFVLRRLKTDREIISDLPEKHEACVYCTLTREQAALYQGVLDELAAALKERASRAGRRGLVLGSITRLKQICNHPAHFLGEQGRLDNRSGKLERLRDMLEEVVASGEAALVFTQYAKMGTLLQHYLQHEFGCFVPFLHGGTPRADRDAQVAAFQAQQAAAIFVLSLKAGGTGLNLTRANHIFHFDRWWNPAVENQATDRAYRIGQTRDVMVHKFVCVGTLEERIEAMIREKSALADDIVVSGEAWLTDLDDAALRDALSLSQDAVGEWES